MLSLSLPSVQAGMRTWQMRDTPARVRGLAVFAQCLAGGWKR